MRKTVLFILFAGVLSTVFSSCDNTKTPQEYLREEKKAIQRYIDRNKIKVTEDYPADSIFKENEYFRTKDGLYFHVANRGNGKKVKEKQEVTVRFESYFDIKTYVGGDTTQYTLSYTQFPFVFNYGINQFKNGIPEKTDNSFGCTGWLIPLAYVSEDAIVDLIIPSSLGSQSNNSSYRPVFYKNLHYNKFK